MSRIKQLKGFTLIELIVVVIIIGVLAAIAAVAYNQFIGDSRTTAAYASAKQVATAITASAATAEKSPLAVVSASTDLKTDLKVSGDAVLKFEAKGASNTAGTVTDESTDRVTVKRGSQTCDVTLGTDAASVGAKAAVCYAG